MKTTKIAVNVIFVAWMLFGMTELKCQSETVSDDPIQSFTQKIKGESCEITITMKTRKFETKKHVVKIDKGIGYIDGKKVIGTDGGVKPFNEFELFQITWDGKLVELPDESYLPVYNPQLSDSKGVSVTLSDHQDILLIVFECGDATRTTLSLTVSKDGVWHRFAKSEGED